jgi:hypothetical protein
MKKLLILVVFAGMLISFPQQLSACEIDFEIIKGEKESYTAGDQFMVLVKVVLTHRACPEALNKTKFKMQGLKVMKSTPWKEITTMEHHRKLIVKVVDNSVEHFVLNAIRTCDKDGGFGSLTLAVAPKD